MNKEQLLAWAVHEVKVWPQLSVVLPEGVAWRNHVVIGVHLETMWSEHDSEFDRHGYVTRDEWEAARVACGLPQFEAFVSVEDAPVTAHSILEAAGGHMCDRAATYDKPEGERSMGATVEAFRAITGHKLTEEQGWLFMSLLKAVRSQQGAYRADSYEDGAAYCALAGEAAARERGSNKAEG